MNGKQAYALSKKYTKDTSESLGSLKGAPCTITEIKTDKDGNSVVTFTWESPSGDTRTSDMTVQKGVDAPSIESVEIDKNNHLLIKMNNGEKIDCGVMPSTKIEISKDEGNSAEMRSDGVYVSSSGVQISQEEGNTLESKADGLFRKRAYFDNVIGNRIKSLSYAKEQNELTLAKFQESAFYKNFLSQKKGTTVPAQYDVVTKCYQDALFRCPSLEEASELISLLTFIKSETVSTAKGSRTVYFYRAKNGQEFAIAGSAYQTEQTVRYTNTKGCVGFPLNTIVYNEYMVGDNVKYINATASGSLTTNYSGAAAYDYNGCVGFGNAVFYRPVCEKKGNYIKTPPEGFIDIGASVWWSDRYLGATEIYGDGFLSQICDVDSITTELEPVFKRVYEGDETEFATSDDLNNRISVSSENTNEKVIYSPLNENITESYNSANYTKYDYYNKVIKPHITSSSTAMYYNLSDSEDIVFKLTEGKYRLPTRDELVELLNSVRYAVEYDYTNKCHKSVLTSTADGNKKIELGFGVSVYYGTKYLKSVFSPGSMVQNIPTRTIASMSNAAYVSGISTWGSSTQLYISDYNGLNNGYSLLPVCPKAGHSSVPDGFVDIVSSSSVYWSKNFLYANKDLSGYPVNMLGYDFTDIYDKEVIRLSNGLSFDFATKTDLEDSAKFLTSDVYNLNSSVNSLATKVGDAIIKSAEAASRTDSVELVSKENSTVSGVNKANYSSQYHKYYANGNYFKYISNSNQELEISDDVCAVAYGPDCRIPEYNDFVKLINNTVVKEYNTSKKYAILADKETGAELTLPINTGRRSSTSTYNDGTIYATRWSIGGASTTMRKCTCAKITFTSDGTGGYVASVSQYNTADFYSGFTVRGVSKATTGDTVRIGDTNWMKFNVCASAPESVGIFFCFADTTNLTSVIQKKGAYVHNEKEIQELVLKGNIVIATKAPEDINLVPDGYIWLEE